MLWALCLCGSAMAQEAGASHADAAVMGQVAKGVVRGDVYDAATERPIRFAEVHLVPVPVEVMKETVSPAGEAGHGSRAAEVPEKQVTSVVGRSDMDGRVLLRDVPPGDYLVTALDPAYVSSLPTLGDLAGASVEQLREMVKALATVHVVSGQEATIRLGLHRGAVLFGTMRYADGSPATGVGVFCEPEVSLQERLRASGAGSKPLSPVGSALEQLSIPAFSGPPRGHETDDKGRFRISGLAPGRYVLGTGFSLPSGLAQVQLVGGGQLPGAERHPLYPEMILVYTPGVFRRGAAKVFALEAEDQVEADLTIDTAGLHTLRGRAYVGKDGHVPSGLILELREAGSADMARSAEGEADGSFQLHDLPAGKYLLTITASDIDPDPNGVKPARFYREVTIPVNVGQADLAVPDVVLSPAALCEPN